METTEHPVMFSFVTLKCRMAAAQTPNEGRSHLSVIRSEKSEKTSSAGALTFVCLAQRSQPKTKAVRRRAKDKPRRLTGRKKKIAATQLRSPAPFNFGLLVRSTE